jgi:hypothetical protein
VPKLDERHQRHRLSTTIDPDKVYQPIVYQPFSPPPIPVSSRPPLSNACKFLCLDLRRGFFFSPVLFNLN